MTFDDFKEIFLEDFNRFLVYYQDNNKSNPEHFPLDMGEGDWLDQYLIFLSNG